jgi:histidine decarboxylase
MYRMDLELIDSDDTGEIVYEDLERKMRKHLDRPMIININVGTTVKGASDTVDDVIAILHRLKIPRDRFFIHVDGALSGVVLPFVSSRCENKRVTFTKPIDSVSVSGHKMLGTPMPSGIVITRAEHMKRWGSDVAYLNSIDTTIMGSRNGQAAIAMWVALQRKGIDGLRADVVQCLDNAKYLKELFDGSGIKAWLNEFSTTVTFERPPEFVVQKWQLACKNDIAHVVVMPSVHKKKLRQFHHDVVEAKKNPNFGEIPSGAAPTLLKADTTQFTGGG